MRPTAKMTMLPWFEPIIHLFDNSLLRKATTVIGSRIGITIISILTGIIVARAIGANGKGILGILTVYSNLVMSIFTLGMRPAGAFYIGQYEEQRQNIISTLISIIIFTSIIGSIICFFVLQLVSGVEVKVEFIVITAVTLPLLFIQNYAQGIYIGLGEVRQYSKLMILPVFFSLLTTILLVGWLKLDVYGVLLGSLAANLLVVGIISQKMKRQFILRPMLDWKLINGILRIGIVYGITLLLFNANLDIDIVILSHLTDTGKVGQYSLGVNIAEQLLKIPAALGVVIWAESVGTKDKNASSLQVIKLISIVLPIAAILALMIGLVSDLLIPLVYGSDFVESVRALQLLLPGIVSMTIYNIIHFDLVGKGKPLISLYVLVVTVIVNVLGNFLLVPQYGIDGAAIASSISYSLAVLMIVPIYMHINNLSYKEFLTIGFSGNLLRIPKFKKKSVKNIIRND